MSLHQKKYQNAVLYLCHKLKGEVRGKKKLAKLLYFADFDLYEKSQKSITGDIYKAYPKGPLPVSLQDVVDEMLDKNMIKVDSVLEWGKDYAPTEIYKCLIEPDVSVFNEEEKKILDRVIRRYGELNGEQLAELSHAEAPYSATELYQEIPYEFSYYRGTDFQDL
ncbi:MAG: Panacea domain-containing protein [Patescibacteria group bacterium]